jgi:hypothetical protein
MQPSVHSSHSDRLDHCNLLSLDHFQHPETLEFCA